MFQLHPEGTFPTQRVFQKFIFGGSRFYGTFPRFYKYGKGIFGCCGSVPIF